MVQSYKRSGREGVLSYELRGKVVEAAKKKDGPALDRFLLLSEDERCRRQRTYMVVQQIKTLAAARSSEVKTIAKHAPSIEMCVQ
jgi:hypothetical protein